MEGDGKEYASRSTYPLLVVGLDHFLHTDGPLGHFKLSPLMCQLQNRSSSHTGKDVASAERRSDELFLA